MIVTLLERQKGRRRVNVHLDGAFAFSVAADVALQHGLREGQRLADADVEALRDADARQRCVQSALRLVARRPRSERELRDALRRRRFDRDHIDAAVSRLRAMGYLDDAAFARFWVETRDASSPRSRRLLKAELRSRGVEAPTATEATVGIEDEDAAVRAASRRLRAFAGLDEETFRRRLGGFLLRRGFSYAVAERVVSRCWREIAETEADAEDGR
ncbi:MAG TPA: RecX family transcriptional regulator [Dehalococcoidia bacterium]|nr:RecX family transcriptional regulator [Dehalococcoidia bacterium]